MNIPTAKETRLKSFDSSLLLELNNLIIEAMNTAVKDKESYCEIEYSVKNYTIPKATNQDSRQVKRHLTEVANNLEAMGYTTKITQYYMVDDRQRQIGDTYYLNVNWE